MSLFDANDEIGYKWMAKCRFKVANVEYQCFQKTCTFLMSGVFALINDFIASPLKFNAIKMFINFLVENNLLLHTSKYLDIINSDVQCKWCRLIFRFNNSERVDLRHLPKMQQFCVIKSLSPGLLLLHNSYVNKCKWTTAPKCWKFSLKLH